MGISNIKVLSRLEYLEVLEVIDTYIRVGGSIFQYHRYSDNVSKLKRFLALYRIKKKGIKIVNLGSNLGPFNTRFSHYLCKKELKLFDLVTLRDDESYNLAMHRYGLSNCKRYDDIVFDLIDTDLFNANKETLRSHKKTLGITAYRSVRNIEENYSFYQQLANFTINFIKSNDIERVRLFCFDTENENDLSAAHHIMEILNKQVSTVIEIVPYLGSNTDQFLELFSQSDYVIAIRFHGAVLSDIFKIPFYPIAYSNKMENYIIDTHGISNVPSIKGYRYCSEDLTKFSNRSKSVMSGQTDLLNRLEK